MKAVSAMPPKAGRLSVVRCLEVDIDGTDYLIRPKGYSMPYEIRLSKKS